jgi:hypothetical protein
MKAVLLSGHTEHARRYTLVLEFTSSKTLAWNPGSSSEYPGSRDWLALRYMHQTHV